MKIKLPTWVLIFIVVASVLFIGYIDWITTDELNVLVFYFIPIALAGWSIGLGTTISISFLSVILILLGHTHSTLFYGIWDALVLLFSFLIIGCFATKIRLLLIRDHELLEALHASFAEVKALEGLLPICCQCKMIRDGEGQWHQMEAYIVEHTNSHFSHSYCPECGKKAMEDLDAGQV